MSMEESRQVSNLSQVDMSRLEEFMTRMESGQGYGSQCDIDMLLEEIVKRLERRVIAAVDQLQTRVLQQGANSSPTAISGSSSSASGSSIPRPPSRVVTKLPTQGQNPNMNLLSPDVQDFVQVVVRSSMERIMDNDNSGNTRGQKHQESKGKKSDGIAKGNYTQRPAKAMMYTAMMSDEEDDDNTWRMAEEDDTWTMTNRTNDKSSASDQGMTGSPASSGHGGLYLIQEETSRAKPKPKSAPIPDRRNVATEGNRRKMTKRLVRGSDHDVNTNYTFSLRRSVGGAIPKYLQNDGPESKAAMMHMFNMIRTAMADDSIECMVADVLGVKTTSAPRAKGSKKGTETDGGCGYFEKHTWSASGHNDTSPDAHRQTEYGKIGVERNSLANIEEPYVYERDYVKPTPPVQKQNVKNNPYAKRETDNNAPNSISRFIQKGSPRDAMCTMSDYIQMEKFPGEWDWQIVDINGNDVNMDEAMTTSTTKSIRQPGTTKNQNVAFAYKGNNGPSYSASGKGASKKIGNTDSMRYDSSMAFNVRRRLRHAIPKFTHKEVSGALWHLSEKLMDEFPLYAGSPAMSNVAVSEKEKCNTINETITFEVMPWETKGNCVKGNEQKVKTSSELGWLTKGKVNTSHQAPYVATKGKSAGKATQDLPWVTSSKKDYSDSSYDSPWVTRGKAVNRTDQISGYEQSRASIGTQTSVRALYDEHAIYPQTVTAGRGWNKNSNQSAATISFSSEDGIIQDADDIFYDALTTHTVLQIKSDYTDSDNMSFLKRFRLNLLFRKKKPEKKFVTAVHKVIEARRSGCIDDDGNFVQSFPDPPKKDIKKVEKSPPPVVKPKPKLDKNGNQRVSSSKKRSSNRRRHNPDRNSYPLPEEDDGSEGYASASEMDDFNPTAFLERNRRSAENRFFRDDGDEADNESDSDGNNSSSRRVRFSDDVQHFGEIEGLGEPETSESSDNLDAEDDSPDISLMSLKSKIELFEKVSSNEFLDERSNQGSPPPADLADASSLPTKDRVQLFEDISSGKKPTTCSGNNKTPRRAVESCQYTLTQSKISFFEQLSDKR